MHKEGFMDTVRKNLTLDRQYFGNDITTSNRFRDTNSAVLFDNVQGSYREIYVNGFYLGHNDMRLGKKAKTHTQSGQETVELICCMEGACLQMKSTLASPVHLIANSYNVIYSKKSNAETDWFPTNGRVSVLQIHMVPQLFLEYLTLGDKSQNTVRFEKNIKAGKSCQLCSEGMPLSPYMQFAIDQIINADASKVFKPLYIESKILELLALQLKQIVALEKTPIPTLKPESIKKIARVKAFMEQNLHKTMTLADLSKIAGTNDYAIKKGFKRLYGTPVFAYWNTLKMNMAKKLLLQKTVSIGEVSDKLGYKNQRHFSSAFKKQFGLTPRQFQT